jgi:hypothetical protein
MELDRVHSRPLGLHDSPVDALAAGRADHLRKLSPAGICSRWQNQMVTEVRQRVTREHWGQQPRRGPRREPTDSLQSGLQAKEAGARAAHLFMRANTHPKTDKGHTSDHAHRHSDAL